MKVEVGEDEDEKVDQRRSAAAAVDDDSEPAVRSWLRYWKWCDSQDPSGSGSA